MEKLTLKATKEELTKRGYTVTEISTQKANLGTKKGLSVKKTTKDLIAPIIYEDAILDMESIDEVISVIEKSLQEVPNVNMENFTSYESVKPLLRIKVIPKEGDKDCHVNENQTYDVVKKEFLNLYITPYIEVKEINGSIAVKEHLLDIWGMDAETVISDAIANGKNEYKIQSLTGMIVELKPELADTVPYDPIPTVNVVTNQKNMFGASAITDIDVIRAAAGRHDAVIIPSSIHELMVNQIDGYDSNRIDELRNICRHINREVLDSKDFLSDEVYFYNHEDNTIRIA